MNPLLLVDSYKIHHHTMYPDGMVKLYSNGTCRKSRIPGVDKVVVFGIQYFVKKYLMDAFTKDFFKKDWSTIKAEYERHCPVDTTHIEALHKLGYLPIELKALPEGSQCPIGVPMLTITNTHDDFGWLVNYLETLISCSLWQAYTSATIALQYKKLLTEYVLKTDKNNTEFVQWQGHDFSMRGMSSPESAIVSGMGHLTSFCGTDTIPSLYALEEYYGATGLIGASVPATEHSVMCMGTKENEIETFRRLLKLYPTGILSVVSDTWNLWTVCTDYVVQLKDEILARDGKLVIRPDSGDPVDIICGTWIPANEGKSLTRSVGNTEVSRNIDYSGDVPPEAKGVIELLWDVFGGTVNEQGYKVLDSHIGAIYGDSITVERAKAICERLMAKGFASTNIVFGIGSYTYQYNTRDTFGFAMKATYGEVMEEDGLDGSCTAQYPVMVRTPREIYKAPITDSGEKKSAKGLLMVEEVYTDEGFTFKLRQSVTQEEEKSEKNALRTVFINGQLIRETTLDQIRERLSN